MLYVATIGARIIIKKNYIVLWTSLPILGESISTQHLVLALQAPCTDATSILYRRYKHLVLALQSILYWRYKHLVVSVQNVFRCTANVVVLIHCWQSGVGEQLSKINPF